MYYVSNIYYLFIYVKINVCVDNMYINNIQVILVRSITLKGIWFLKCLHEQQSHHAAKCGRKNNPDKENLLLSKLFI